jgi:hypothetical protein
MLKNICSQDIISAMKRDSDAYYTKNRRPVVTLPAEEIEQILSAKAKHLLETSHEILEPAVQAWIGGNEIPEIVYCDRSLAQIREYRPNFVDAIITMTEYIANPELAEAIIPMSIM